MSYVTCHLCHITSHQCQQPQPQALPLLTPSMFTVGWFTGTQPTNRRKLKTSKLSRIRRTQNISLASSTHAIKKHYQVSYIRCQLSCYMLHATCHLSLTPQTIPLLTPTLCTAGHCSLESGQHKMTLKNCN